MSIALVAYTTIARANVAVAVVLIIFIAFMHLR